MIEAVQRIKQFERQVMWRLRWVALQDAIAWSLLFAGLLSAALILYIRLKPIEFHRWIAVGGVLAGAIAVMLIRWFRGRAAESDAAFAIDEVLGLEDRM